jgi:Uma2 family endonuclease
MTIFANTEYASADRRMPPSGKVTYEEFLAWADDKTFAEWVDGEVQLMSPVSRGHAEISQFLYRVIAAFVEWRAQGEVFVAPFQMRLQQSPRGREPDIMYVAEEHLDRITDTFLSGPADLAVEVVSPESMLLDRGEKYAEYEAEGVREYWIIDPITQRTDFFVLREDGRFTRVDPDKDGLYRSQALDGFSLQVTWLWQRPFPKILDIVRNWEAAN